MSRSSQTAFSARTNESIGSNLSVQLKSYAMAAAAGGVTLLAVAQPLPAEVVYTSAYV
ncbi:MAG: hypothetical protein H0X25_08500 [Acidobacteriales bacterium]|nr:hypothetical protein [Terriglobales bacterium]